MDIALNLAFEAPAFHPEWEMQLLRALGLSESERQAADAREPLRAILYTERPFPHLACR